MGKIKTLSDIEAEKQERERQKFKRMVSEDIKGVFEEVFPKKSQHHRKKKKWWINLLKFLGILILLLLIINLLLGNIWLLKALVKSLFLGG